MSIPALYNVYYDGKIFRKNLTVAQIAKELGCSEVNVYNAAKRGSNLCRKFKVAKVGEKPGEVKKPRPKPVATESKDVPEDFERRWLEETGRFKNVVWVQNGGKRLVIKHGKR